MLSLHAKIRGCIAATWVGSAMGAAVEGWTPERIDVMYGPLEELRSYCHYHNEWQRMPGTTEDGIERQKLMNTAVIRKGGRIDADDLIAAWLQELDPAKMVYKQEAFDLSLLEMARAGVPPRELGRLWPFNNVVSMSRSSHPLGLINAGDPLNAARDTYDVGLVYNNETTFAQRWAALYNAALAAALAPDATVDSVIDTAVEYAAYRGQEGTPYARYDRIRAEIDQALELAARHPGDPMRMREAFYEIYFGGKHFVYAAAQANEVVAKGLAIFYASGGNTRQAVITAVNYGRDTDCLAAVAGGLSGALSGVGDLDPSWIAQVNKATKADPYTNSHLDIDETAEGIYQAVKSKLAKERAYLKKMQAYSE